MKKKLILQIRQDGALLGSWSLVDAPLEMSLIDSTTNQTLATFTAAAPVSVTTAADEEATLIRSSSDLMLYDIGDDFTMPIPEPTLEATPATEEAYAVIGPDDQHEETTAGEDMLTIEKARLPDDDFTMPLPEPVGTVRPSEVWKRWKQSWASAGRLMPGDQVTAFGGRIRLAADGTLLVRTGSRLSGSATLPSGVSQDLPPGGRLYILPPGASVMLRWKENGIYVRSEPVEESVAQV